MLQAENDITKFKQEYSLDQLRCLRLPLIRRSFLKNGSAYQSGLPGNVLVLFDMIFTLISFQCVLSKN